MNKNSLADKFVKIGVGIGLAASLYACSDKPRFCDTVDSHPQFMSCEYKGKIEYFTKINDKNLLMLEKDGKKIYFDTMFFNILII